MKSRKNKSGQESELMKFLFQVVEKEKMLKGNPFLAGRVMAEIESSETPEVVPVFRNVFQIAAIAAGLALIVLGGINLGTFAGKQISERNTIVLLNDAHIERIELLITE